MRLQEMARRTQRSAAPSCAHQGSPALLSTLPRQVRMGIGSNITSFGLGLCVKNGDGWAHIPGGSHLIA